MRRTGTAAIAVALAMALSSGLASGDAQTSYEPETCGGVVLEGIGAYAIQARRMSCTNGRELAMRRMATSSCGATICRVGRFRCYERRINEDLTRVRCTRKPSLVSFKYGTVSY